MSTKLEELIVELKAKKDNFDKNIKESGKAINTFSRQAKTRFGSLQSKAADLSNTIFSLKGVAVAAGVGGLAVLAKDALDTADSIAKLGSNTGISTDLLQELNFAASQTGVSQQDLNSSLLRFNRGS